MTESDNRPYLGGNTDNSSNTLAVNSNYLFYWDGKNLQAMDKATGDVVGTPLTITNNNYLWQGGIIADECNNIFVGNNNGTITVFKFNGTTFDDNAAPDLSIPGFPNASVYDLAYDAGNQLIYASGNGFVASLDISGYCASTIYTISVTSDCATSSATATVSPAPSTGSIITYSLYKGTDLVSSNSTGQFNGLDNNTPYTVKSVIDLGCSGVQGVANFTITGPQLSVVTTNSGCPNNQGTMTMTGSGTYPPYIYSLDGVNFQSNNIFGGLSSDIYHITIKDSKGCINNVPVKIDAGLAGLETSKIDATCGAKSGSISANAAMGVAPFKYSIDGVTYSSNNIFNGLAPGAYKVMVKDAVNCIGTSFVTISTTIPPVIDITKKDAFCENNNGSIRATASAGLNPYLFSIDGTNFQNTGIFDNLAAGNYSIDVKDKNGCLTTEPVIIQNIPSPVMNADITSASCYNNDGTITALTSGGAPPFQYSLNAGAIQASNYFTGLPAGNYSVSIKDANGCAHTVSTVIPIFNSVVVDAGSDKTICEGTKVSMNATSNANSISWFPATGINSINQLNTSAAPTITTQYFITATTGVCNQKDSVMVFVNPAPIPDAGPDTVICYGSSAQLQGAGGKTFSWSPTIFLDNPKSASPIVLKPLSSLSYHLMVTDEKGCRSLQPSTMTVNVTPPAVVYIGKDTILAVGEPLPLVAKDVNKSGFSIYSWSPNYMISDARS